MSRDKEKSEKMQMQAHAASSPAAPPGGAVARLEGDIQAHLGRQLRAVFDEVANQPVPDRLVKLLEELERKGASEKPKGNA